MFQPDKPISSPEEDAFNRSEFAKHLARYLEMLAHCPSSVIAIRGNWGTGKTSLINMVKRELEQVNDPPIVIAFNPWTCVSEEQLVPGFMNALRNGLAKSLGMEKVRAAGNRLLRAIEQYAAALTPLDVVMIGNMI